MHLKELLQLAAVVSHTAVYKRYIRRFPFFRNMILCLVLRQCSVTV